MLPPILMKADQIVARTQRNAARRAFWLREKEIRQYLKDLPIFAYNFFSDKTQDAWSNYNRLYAAYISDPQGVDAQQFVDAYVQFMLGLEAWRIAIENGIYDYKTGEYPDTPNITDIHPTEHDCTQCPNNWICSNL